jgi:hypothetical protein
MVQKRQILRLFNSVCLLILFGHCTEKPVPQPVLSEKVIAVPSLAPTQANTSERVIGNCIVMNPPGSSENLFSPCNKLALQFVYEKNKKLVITIVRTQESGTFEINIPEGSPWKISSTVNFWQADVDFVKNSDGTKKLVVILKPEKTPSPTKK